MNFTSTHPDFQRKINAIAKVAELTGAEVYEYWQQYCRQCTNYDQSPVISEFIVWYTFELGGCREELQAALDGVNA